MNSPALLRELINEHITPEEERVWMTWWAEHPEDTAEMQAFIKEQELLMTEAKRLLDQGEQPGSPAAQELLKRHNTLMSQYHVRERNSRQLAWNTEATTKWLNVGIKLGRVKDGGRGIRDRPSARASRSVVAAATPGHPTPILLPAPYSTEPFRRASPRPTRDLEITDTGQAT